MPEDPKVIAPVVDPPIIPAATPSPMEQKIAEMESKLRGLEGWENSRNQESVAMRKEIESLRLDREQFAQMAASNNRQPDQLAQIDAAMAKAIDEQDFARQSQLTAAKADLVNRTLAITSSTTLLNTLVRSAKGQMDKDAYKELEKQIYVDSDHPERGFRVDPTQYLTNSLMFDRDIKIAQDAVISEKVRTGKIQEEAVQQHLAKEEEKKRIITNQTPVAGGMGQPAPIPPIDEKQALIDNLNKNAQILRGEIPPEG